MLVVQVSKSVWETIFEDYLRKLKGLEIKPDWKAEEVERYVLQLKEVLENFR